MSDDALRLSDRVQRIKPSPTLAVGNRAEELILAGKKILNLGMGEPDFDTPEHIKEAAIKAIREGHTKYTAVDGIKSLKQAVINKFAQQNQLNYSLNQIIVSCGAKQCIFNFFSAILNPGDEVIIPAPYWVSYPDIVKLCDGQPVSVSTTFKNNFKLTPQDLKSALTKKTRAFVLNSPSNPTGLAYSFSELKALGDVLLQYPDVLIMLDDIYEHHLWHHTPFKNLLNACPGLYNRCVVINGVAKTYAMTGWRIGYAAGPPTIIAAMKKAQSQITSNPTSISQYAALEALEGDQSCVEAMNKEFKARHDYFVQALQKIPGFKCILSDGTFYTFPSIEAFLGKKTGINTDTDFSEFLLNELEIAVVPGTAFGAPHHIRMSYAVKMNVLKDAIKKLAQLPEMFF